MPDIIAGKWKVRGVLGEGGTGIVYDAVEKDDGREVALKVMHPALAGDTQIRGRFLREAAILRRLEGPNICSMLEAGEGDDGVLYMALAKIDGPSLHSVIEKELISVERALEVMIEVCAALRIAHGQGVIHRDLKPANVILRDAKTAVVVDFGMSKIVTGAGTGTTNLTAHNMVFGTPEYMSPEQARGDELDARCDVYACGCMLYEMLAGSPPFTGPTPLNVLTAHLTSELEPPSQRKPGRIPPAVESVVLHALARDRNARYPSASALAAAIMHARARPDDVVSLHPDAFATNPAGTDAFALTMPVIDQAPLSATQLAPSHPPSRPTSKTPPPTSTSSKRVVPVLTKPPPASSGRGLWIMVWVLAAAVSIGAGVYFALRG